MITQTDLGTKLAAGKLGFTLGWFAAITISTDEGVVLDLNTKTLKQSATHNLLQRFYANIELSSAPFDNQGPATFGTAVPAQNVIIKNGTVGLGAHHAIHGNGPRNVLIENMTFRDHEVAPTSINGAENIIINNCKSLTHRTDVDIKGIFSTGLFLRPYINQLANDSSKKSETFNYGTLTTNITYEHFRDRLKTSVNAAYEGVINSDATWLYNNATNGFWFKLYAMTNAGLGTVTNAGTSVKVVDGNAYGFLFNERGVAVNGFPSKPKAPADTIYIKNCSLQNVYGNVMEVPAMRIPETKKPLIDPIGAVLPLFHSFRDMTLNSDFETLGNTEMLSIETTSGGSKWSEILAAWPLIRPRVTANSSITGSGGTDATLAHYNVVLACEAIVNSELTWLGTQNRIGSTKFDVKRGTQYDTFTDWLKGKSTDPSNATGDWLSSSERYTAAVTGDTAKYNNAWNALTGHATSAFSNSGKTATSGKLIMNGDTMFHVNKGVLGIKTDGCNNVMVSNTILFNVVNFGLKGQDLCGVYEKSHNNQNLLGYNGASTRGCGASASFNVRYKDVRIIDARSSYSECIGIDSLFITDLANLNEVICQNMISGIHYFKDASGEVKNINCTRDDFKNNPTPGIKCTGARFDDQNNRINVNNLVILDQTSSTEFQKENYAIMDKRNSVNNTN